MEGPNNPASHAAELPEAAATSQCESRDSCQGGKSCAMIWTISKLSAHCYWQGLAHTKLHAELYHVTKIPTLASHFITQVQLTSTTIYPASTLDLIQSVHSQPSLWVSELHVYGEKIQL